MVVFVLFCRKQNKPVSEKTCIFNCYDIVLQYAETLNAVAIRMMPSRVTKSPECYIPSACPEQNYDTVFYAK